MFANGRWTSGVAGGLLEPASEGPPGSQAEPMIDRRPAPHQVLAGRLCILRTIYIGIEKLGASTARRSCLRMGRAEAGSCAIRNGAGLFVGLRGQRIAIPTSTASIRSR